MFNNISDQKNIFNVKSLLKNFFILTDKVDLLQRLHFLNHIHLFIFFIYNGLGNEMKEVNYI